MLIASDIIFIMFRIDYNICSVNSLLESSQNSELDAGSKIIVKTSSGNFNPTLSSNHAFSFFFVLEH